MRILSRLQMLVLFILLALPHCVQSQTVSDRSFVSLITCGPGNELYSVFGHTAIRVADPATGMDVVYNFGTFDFDTPNFYLKFVKGDLQYFASASSYYDFVNAYQYYNRDVFEQRLNLTQQQKQQVADELVMSLTDETKKYYTYKFFDRNCTTMVADILQKHLPYKLSEENEDKGKTTRKIIVERLHNKFYENLGISLIFGYKTDKQMQKLFLPVHLMQSVANTKDVSSKPLAEPAVTVYKSTAEEEKSVWNNYYTYALAMLLLMISSRNSKVRRVLYFVMGVLGLFLSLVGFYSYHAEIAQNYNALLVNPLFLVLLYFSYKKNSSAVKKVAYVLLGLTGIYILFMLNKPHFLIMLPLIALVLVLLAREALPGIKTLRKNSPAKGE